MFRAGSPIIRRFVRVLYMQLTGLPSLVCCRRDRWGWMLDPQWSRRQHIREGRPVSCVYSTCMKLLMMGEPARNM